MSDEYNPVNVSDGEYKIHPFPDAWLYQVDDEKMIMSIRDHCDDYDYPSERPVYYYKEEKFTTYEKLKGFSTENSSEEQIEQFQEDFENHFQNIDEKDKFTIQCEELELNEDNKQSLNDYVNILSNILSDISKLEFSYSCQWDKYELSVWEMGELYVVVDKDKNEIISFIYDESTTLQEGDGSTEVYLLNEKDLIVVNNGDVSSLVFFKKI